MGKIFCEHPNGKLIYCCKHCDMPLANRKSMTSSSFQGATGKALLFRKVVNIKTGEVQKRMMITGLHWVRDVFCKRCSNRLGWMYEMAKDIKQKYKEAQVILEWALIYNLTVVNAIDDLDLSSESDEEQ